MTARFRHPLRGPAAALFIALLAGTAAVGCAGVNRLREAQEAFNQAAAAENRLRFDRVDADGTEGIVLVDLTAARGGYTSALVSLEKMAPGDVAQLKRDGLWGNALTLKALAEWRLGLYDKARATADEAQRTAGDQMHPRDRALLEALPGLIKNDEAYRKIYAQRPLPEVEGLLREAVADVQRARGAVEKTHPVQLYLIQVQLVTYKNLRTAYARLANQTSVPADNPAVGEAQKNFQELSDLLKQVNPDARGQMIAYWARVCGDLTVPR
jgi:hypothetical protein